MNIVYIYAYIYTCINKTSQYKNKTKQRYSTTVL